MSGTAMNMPTMPWSWLPISTANMTTSGCTRKRVPMMSGAAMCPSTSWMPT